MKKNKEQSFLEMKEALKKEIDKTKDVDELINIFLGIGITSIVIKSLLSSKVKTNESKV